MVFYSLSFVLNPPNVINDSCSGAFFYLWIEFLNAVDHHT